MRSRWRWPTTDYDHRWLINPRSGRLVLWTSDTGADGEHPVDLEDLDLIPIDPVPSYVWYQDMVDFADGISDVESQPDRHHSKTHLYGCSHTSGRLTCVQWSSPLPPDRATLARFS